MHNRVVAALDWTPRWVRCVVCSDRGEELKRAVWPRDEAADHLLDFLTVERTTYGTPLTVVGRCGAPWPEGFLQQLTLAGFSFDLIDGPPLGSMFRLERRYREDVDYRPAGLLASIHLSRRQLWNWRAFVLRWTVEQARRRLDELASELQSQWPDNWNDHDSPSTAPSELITFAEAFRVTPQDLFSLHSHLHRQESLF